MFWKFENIFLPLFFISKNTNFFLYVALCVITTYTSITNFRSVVFEKNNFIYFTFPFHNFPKNEILRLFFGEMLCHMGVHQCW